MPKKFERRHSRWYELILFSNIFQFLLGFAVVVLMPNWLRWGELLFSWPLTESQFNTVLANSSAYVFSFFMLHKFKRYPGTRSLPFIIPTLFTAWLLVFAVLLFLRQDYYARQVLVYSFLLANIWAFAGYFLGRNFRKPKLALVPFGRALELVNTPYAIITELEQPDLAGRRYDAVVADLHSVELPAEWAKFLAKCTLARIPVYHTQQLIESITGRVKVEHLSENIFGALLPSGFYLAVKRFFDVFLVVLTAPLWLIIMFVTGIIIKLESPGPMFYTQERIGQSNKKFMVYKLRSMYQSSKDEEARFAKARDSRVTRVGKYIRKNRIDEIPQFINVLKGDMSIIGPRPEQQAFVKRFEKEVPFYSYRHVVKPGITGWAQVMHGYADSTLDTRVKIEYDFYYIKHFSMWLDILIIIKTIRTVLTGFGAR